MRVITLDWDWDCAVFRPETNELIRQITSDPRVKEVWYRCSSSGHIHVKVILSEDVDFWESLYLRAKWDDDANRIRMDIIRWWENGEVNRLWDYKVVMTEKGFEIRRAGKWVRIYPS